MQDPDLLQYVHPDVVWRHRPLPAEQNALSYWNQAAACVEPLDEDIAEAWYPDLDGECPLRPPSDSILRRTRENLHRNQRSLDLMHRGIEVGRVQFAVTSDSKEVDEDSCSTWCEPFGLLILNAACMLADGRLHEAARELSAALRCSSMVCNGEAGEFACMAGNHYKLWAFKEMRDLAAADQVTLETLRSLIRAIHEDKSAAGLADAMRIDFCRMLEWRLSTMHSHEPLETLLDAFLARNYSMPEPDLGIEGLSPTPTDERIAWRRERILRLLDGHPYPFKLADTVKAASEGAAKELTSLMAPWKPGRLEEQTTPRNQALDEECWPDHLRPDVPYEFVGTDNDAQECRQQARDFCLRQQWQDTQPPTDEQIDAARIKLRSIENPIGKLLLDRLTVSTGGTRLSAFLTCVEAGATEAVLGVRAFAAARGDLPKRLDDLVTGGLLPCAPLDPFAGEPLRYSRERRLIWSVGTDGIDHGGIPNHDYLWQIPQWSDLKAF